MLDVTEIRKRDDEILRLMDFEDKLRRLLKRAAPGSGFHARVSAQLAGVTALLDALDLEIADIRRRMVETEISKMRRQVVARCTTPQPTAHIS